MSTLAGDTESPTEMFADSDYGGIDLGKMAVFGYGYRWIRLRRELSPLDIDVA